MPSSFFNLGRPMALQLLWLLVPLAVLFAFDLRRRQRVLQLFVERSLLDDVAPRRSVSRPILKFGLWMLGIATLILGLAQPRWDPRQIELEQRGQNILFCLDVSNSMRARDVDPSRLEAAKAAVRSLLAQLPAGHQVGIMAYAGDAAMLEVLGFSKDGRYFGIVQSGVEDGSGYPYARLDIVGLPDAPELDGFQVTRSLEAADATREDARSALMEDSRATLAAVGISESSSPAAPAALPLLDTPVGSMSTAWGRLELKEAAAASPACEVAGISPTTVELVLHTAAPAEISWSRAPEEGECPLRYALAELRTATVATGGRALAALLAYERLGFEGADLRYVPVILPLEQR